MTGIKEIDDFVGYSKMKAAWTYLLVIHAPQDALSCVDEISRITLRDLPWSVITPVAEDCNNRYIGKGLK